jgi:hypothetical protein
MLVSSRSSTAVHQLYNKTHNGLPVFNLQLKVNTYRHKTVIKESVIKLLLPENNIPDGYTTLAKEEGYLFEKDAYKAVSCIEILTNEGKSYTLFTFENSLIYQTENNLYFKDTIVIGNVFLPDPITSSNTPYGIPLMDNNDVNSIDLENELFARDILISWDNDSFRLENEHLIITNHSSPDIPVTIQKNDDFKFDRSQIGFEEINVIYHLTKFAEYVKDTLGYSQIVKYQIPVDVYALSNADQSEFIGATSPPRLNFGQGSVDDAEDADIIIHEYTHAISHSTAPNTLYGSERKAIEEGIGDYFAAVYSKKLNINDYKKIFNWDGHNEFWAGRSIDNNDIYPDDIQGSKYIDGDLYASVLMEIRNEIPDTVADKIILESMFSWFSNMTFEDAGQLLIEADTSIYAGFYSPSIKVILCDRGLSSANCENSITKKDFNQLSLSINNEILHINNIINTSYSVELYDTNGKVVTKENSNQISLHNISKGVYFIKLNTGLKVYTKKFIVIK